ncbi:MAG: foldase protein PrsA [Bacteroidales bacterium]
MKKIVVLLLIIFSINSFAQKYQEIDGVIAVVGASMIKLSDLETTYLQNKSSAENSDMTRCDILESMLLNKLMLHQAEIDSVVITETDIENELSQRLKYMVQVYGSQERLEKQMNKTMVQIREYFHDIIKENLMIQQTQNKIIGDITITPKEVADYFQKIPQDSLPNIEDQYELSQIVILPHVSEEEKQQVKRRLNDIRERIIKGAKFTTLASLYSDDEVSAKSGGELGFFSRGDMVSEFESMAFSLQPGEISPVFETKYGYHIVQMIARQGDRVNCRHILLMPKVSATQLYNAKVRLDSIKALIDANQISFEDAIIKYSEDDGKINGGLIINRNNASAIFSLDAINTTIGNVDNVDFASLNEGDYTDVIEFKSEFSHAYRLIKVKKRVVAHKVNLTDDFDRLQSIALNQKKTEIIRNWAKRMIDRTYIKLNDKYINCSFTLKWNKK